MVEKHALPPEILADLQKYEQHVDCLCLECGYQGPMGVAGYRRPWYGRWWFFAILFLICWPLAYIGGVTFQMLLIGNFWLYAFFAGIFFAWGLLRNAGTKQMFHCPACNASLYRKS